MNTYRLRVRKFATNKLLFDGVFIDKKSMETMLHKIKNFFNGWRADDITEDTLLFVYDTPYPRQLKRPRPDPEEEYKDSN